MNTTNSKPLSGIKVLDMSVERAGPVAVRLLADWGAEVIRLEPPPSKVVGSVTGRRRGADEQNLHRNKRCLAIDLKSEAGQAVLKKLVQSCDVVVENFRTTVKERLGLSYEKLYALNPRIILASISGFGQDGPYSQRPAYDQIIQGMSGLASITGVPGQGPMRVGVAIADTTAGMFLGQGILLALLHRATTGKGQWVHTSLMESMLNKLDFQAARYLVDGDLPDQQGNSHPTATPMSTYKTADGWANLAATAPHMWVTFCNALNAQHLLKVPHYQEAASRTQHRAELEREINEITQAYSTADLVDTLTKVGLACGPVNSIAQAFDDPQVRHLRVTRPVTHPERGELPLLRSPINLSRCPHPERFDLPAPDNGQHTDMLLQELGLSEVEIHTLREKGVIA